MKRRILPFLAVLGVFLAPFTAFAYNSTSNGVNFSGPDYTPMTIDNILYRSEVYNDGDAQRQIVDVTFCTSISPVVSINRPEASLSNPVYCNGFVRFGLVPVYPSTSVITNTSLYSFDYSSVSNPDGIRTAVFQSSPTAPIFIYLYFDNFCITDPTVYINVPTILVRDTISFYEIQEYDTLVVPDLTQLSMDWALRSQYREALAFLAAPDINTGFASIISDSVVSAINSSAVADVSSLLSSIYSMDSSYYVGVLNYLSDLSSSNNQIKMYLMANLPDILTYIKTISSEQLRFNDALYTLIYNYIYATDTDTQLQSQFSDQSQALESINNALDVSKPNVDGIVNGADLYLTPDLIAVQGDAFSWLNNGFILPILLLTFTIGLLGFVLYGKSG